MSYFDDHEDFMYERERRIERAEARIVAENSKKKSKPIFSRGYKECRDRLSNNSTFSRSCFNCAFYFQASGDKEEVCQRSDVLEYDMVVNNNQIYCLKWEQCRPKDTMFNKSGRSRLD